MKRISVILTTYNRKYEVRRALDSVYAQTVKPYEIILVDDGSEDGTKEYIDTFHFAGLRYFLLQKNQGPGAARNYGIMKAKGEYIAFLDSDNEWYINKLEEFEKVISSSEDLDVIYSMYKKHNKFECDIMPNLLNSDKSMMLYNEIWLQNPADASSSVYRKGFLEEIGLFSEEMTAHIDWELLLRGMRKKNINLRRLDKVLTENWTMHNGISENEELMESEQAKLLLEYRNDYFVAMSESYKAVEKQCMDIEEHYKKLLARKSSFYDVMVKWLQLKMSGGSIAEILRENGYEHIAIFGAGKHGKLLCCDLYGTDIHVEYFIDRNKEAAKDINIAVYTLDEMLPLVDAIIISTYLEFEIIKQELMTRCDYQLLALNDLIEWQKS